MSNPSGISREHVRYALRADTAGVLTSRNEVLLDRELCVEIDTGRFKLGNGQTPYNSLEYIPLGDVARMRATPTHLEWRPNAFSDWTPLISLDQLRGEPGDPAFIELQKSSTHVQWRNSPTSPWTNLIPLEDLRGEAGKDVDLLDVLEVQMRTNDTHIQWRSHLSAPWSDLVSLNTLKGADGTVSMRTSDTHIQWRSGLMGPFNNLVSLESLRGPVGGPTGVMTTGGNVLVEVGIHKNMMLRHSSGTIILPTTEGFSLGDIVEVRREAGKVSFSTEDGVLLDYNTTLYNPVINELKDVVAAKVIDNNTWALFGPLEAK